MRLLSLLAAFWLASFAAAAEPPPKNDPPVEQPPADAKAPKVVLVAGSSYYKPGEHEYVAGCAVFADLLRQNGVAPVLATDWPRRPETLAGAKAVVFFFDGAEKHQAVKGDRAARVQKLMDAKVGLVQLHQAADYPKDFADRARGWAGGAWEKGTGQRAHWVAEFAKFPDHPTFRGVKPFKLDDGWLYRIRFSPGMRGVAPLLRTWNPKATAKPSEGQDVVAWAYERPEGGRSFTFTGAHLHASLAQESYRRFLVNGILWSAGLEVPEGGAKVELDPAELPGYLKAAPKKQ